MHVAWLESTPAVIVDCATFGLAFLGGYLALNPPSETQNVLKRFYFASFVVLAVLGVCANAWQRSVEEAKQADARNQFSNNLAEVKKSNDAILNFVANPPKGFTREQVVAVVKNFLDKRQTTPSPLTSLSLDTLLKMVPDVARRLRDFGDGWYGESHNLELAKNEDSEHEGFNQEKEREGETFRWQVTRTQQEWAAEEQMVNRGRQEQLVQLLSDAETLRESLKSKLPKDAQTPDDDAAAALFAKALAEGSAVQSGLSCCPNSIQKAADYLDALAKRASRVKTLQH